jgi:competence protein ComEA
VLTAACISPGAEISLSTHAPLTLGNIYVGGAVKNPGLYPLLPDDSLQNLIQAAGGLQSGADISQITLSIPDPTSTSSAQCININTAESWLLDALPGIGPTTANAIVAYRETSGPYRTLDDLLKVKGIGPSTLDKIRDFISVG